MHDGSYTWLSATEAVRLVAAESLDPQAVVRAHLGAIERRDPSIHAFVYVDQDAAASPGPLSGLTLAVKDNLPVAGMPWTDGSAVWRDRIPAHDSVPVARARAAGAAVLGKTNLPELAAAVGTTNAIFPATHNPWRAGITPGGSSGGSAAAVCAGMATVGMGTDMGGSIRIPASCCGVVGLRPSPDRVPSENVDPAGLSVIGPIGRTVSDVRLLFSVMAQAPAPQPPRQPRSFRIGLADTTALGMDGACADACRRAGDALASAGHSVERIAWESESVAAGYGVVRRASMASFPADPQLFAPGIRKLVEQGRALSALDYFQAFESATAAAYKVVVTPLLDRFDFLLTPTLGLVPMPIEDVPPFLSVPYGRYIQFVLPVSFAHTPAVSIPAGLSDGLPVGVQLVAKSGSEWLLLALAEQLEAMPGFGFQRPPVPE
ncbi:MAG: aspartyl-tRNA(Asn)/glutamyl-tRNA(Gln) amidotransferase subunit [Chloroflexota bacterium]|nr:aspartyl-tRNA(Asn)/glutamyl-tRNA(Gln) amidotransferase subunit [Chloroflexota bacterium]